jgi:hypothetical protein
VSYSDRYAWHFVRLNDAGDALLRDGRPVPPLNTWLEHEGPVEACRSGLHASWRAIDALSFVDWSNAAVCLVEVDGVEHEGGDKLAARRRRIVAMAPVDDLFRLFAREAALTVAHLWLPPPVVLEYLQTGREDLRAAASDAARAAARAAAWAAAWAAASDAAWAAARVAAWAAAWAVASDAASDAAWDRLNDILEQLLLAHLDAHALLEAA